METMACASRPSRRESQLMCDPRPGVDAAEQNVFRPAQRNKFLPRRRPAEADAADGHHVTEHFDPELAQVRLRYGAEGHPRRRLARAGAFEHVAGVVEVVFQNTGEVGVPGSRTRHHLALFFAAIGVLHRQRVAPVLPILVLDQHRHRRADRVRVPHAGDDLDAVRLDLHPAAAPVPLLTAP
jgi:hypothetical protein